MNKLDFVDIILPVSSIVNLPPLSAEMGTGISLPWYPSWCKSSEMEPLHTSDYEVRQ